MRCGSLNVIGNAMNVILPSDHFRCHRLFPFPFDHPLFQLQFFLGFRQPFRALSVAPALRALRFLRFLHLHMTVPIAFHDSVANDARSHSMGYAWQSICVQKIVIWLWNANIIGWQYGLTWWYSVVGQCSDDACSIEHESQAHCNKHRLPA